MKIVSRSTWAVSVAAGLLLMGQVACGRGSNSDDGEQEPDGTGAVGGSANLVGGAGSVGGSAAPVGGAASVGGGGGTNAVLAAQASSPETRVAAFKSAARVLRSETGLERRDVFKIVGLEAAACS